MHPATRSARSPLHARRYPRVDPRVRRRNTSSAAPRPPPVGSSGAGLLGAFDHDETGPQQASNEVEALLLGEPGEIGDPERVIRAEQHAPERSRRGRERQPSPRVLDGRAVLALRDRRRVLTSVRDKRLGVRLSSAAACSSGLIGAGRRFPCERRSISFATSAAGIERRRSTRASIVTERSAARSFESPTFDAQRQRVPESSDHRQRARAEIARDRCACGRGFRWSDGWRRLPGPPPSG